MGRKVRGIQHEPDRYRQREANYDSPKEKECLWYKTRIDYEGTI